MKKSYLLLPIAVIAFGLVAFQKSATVSIEQFTNKAHLQNGGGQAALTGAPGENNCTMCHSGSTLNGQTENILTVLDGSFNTVTSYLPGQSYTVSLTMSSDPAKRGFSATVLSGTTMAGDFVGNGGTGTQAFTGGARKYVSHLSTSNTSATPFWAWTWNAPATDMGDVTFYVASNSANGNNATSGDMIYLSTHTITSSASVSELTAEDANFTAGYSPAAHAVTVEFNSLVSDDMFLNLVDMNGKSVFTYDSGDAIIGTNHEVVSLPESIKNGMYVVHYFVGNKAMSANILVQK